MYVTGDGSSSEFGAMLAAVGAAIAWGVGQAYGKRALTGMSVATYNFARESVGAASAVVLLFYQQPNALGQLGSIPLSVFALAIGGALLGYVMWLLLLFTTIKKYTLSGVIPYFHLSPAFLVLINLVLGIEELTWGIVAGAGLVSAGVFVVAHGVPSAWRALMNGVLASAGNAVWLLVNRECLKTISPSELLMIQSGFSCVVFSIIGMRHREIPQTSHLVDACISGLLCRAIGFGLMFYALSLQPAVTIAPIFRLSLVTATLSSIVWLREKCSIRTLVGTGMVLAGAVWLCLINSPSGKMFRADSRNNAISGASVATFNCWNQDPDQADQRSATKVL